MKTTSFMAAALAVSSVSAWSWPAAVEEFNLMPHVDNFLGRRQDGGSSQASASSQRSSSDAPQSSGQAQSSGTITAPPASASGNSTQSADMPQNTSTVAIDPQDPPGGIQMVQPPASLGAQYYKVGQTVTWQWNYTSLLITPTAIDIVVTATNVVNGGNPSPFTLAINQTVQPTQTFTWDIGEYYSQTSNLPQGTYALIVYDASETDGYSAVPQAGYLAAYRQWTFGIYSPIVSSQATGTDLAYVCATCNGASSLERLTIGALVGVTAITVTSFTWFAGGWGAFA